MMTEGRLCRAKIMISPPHKVMNLSSDAGPCNKRNGKHTPNMTEPAFLT